MEYHLKGGMAMLLNVNKDNVYEGLQKPPSDFPVCGVPATIGNVKQGQHQL